MEPDDLTAAPIVTSEKIEVERLGGLVGYGLPGGHLRSRGCIMLSALSPADQAAMNTLFQRPDTVPKWERDAFRYHLTRQTDCGPQTVVVSGSVVPTTVQGCVRDELVP